MCRRVSIGNVQGCREKKYTIAKRRCRGVSIGKVQGCHEKKYRVAKR